MNSGMNVNPSRAVCLIAPGRTPPFNHDIPQCGGETGDAAHRTAAKSKGGVGFSQVQKSKPTKSDTVLGCPLASAHEYNMYV